ncbi:PLC-like phosphodiesterase [Tricharina praecox]|uniref:PLC-like phosphodiesterase n=1 Tax=Tricharina praecox TaxID=43433 RepID=UPI00222064FB|nr:PLC-like phosphodiesterase [Tricharina praecox]KAI5848902.1 PLC-like phosphodiesterase [Tricharina praecox]
MQIRLLLLLLLPFTTAPSIASLQPFHHTNSTKPAVPAIDLSRWQSLLPDNTPLSHLSIPGTHDTMSYPKPPRHSLPFTSQTQTLPLSTQLLSGIRYLDLRLQHHKDRFVLHHGAVYLHFDLPSVLHIIEEFFSGPGAKETLIVRAACNNCHYCLQSRFRNTRSFLDTAMAYAYGDVSTAEWFQRRVYFPPPSRSGSGEGEEGEGTELWVPTLGETRGKVVFVQDFPNGEEPWGAINWHDREQVQIQDLWDLKFRSFLSKKVAAIKKFFLETVWPLHDPPPPPPPPPPEDGVTRVIVRVHVQPPEPAKPTKPKKPPKHKHQHPPPPPPLPPPLQPQPQPPPPLTINHLSGSGLLCCTPAQTSRYVYKTLYEWLRHGWDGGGGRPLGIVAADYVTTNVARVIVEKNFLKGGAGEGVDVDFRWGFWEDGWRQMVEGRAC